MTPRALAILHAKAFSTTRAWSAEEFTSLLDHQGTILCGDERAFALIRVTFDEAELLTLATDPANRRQGLASAALRSAESAARDAGATKLFLEVAEDNTAACVLYDKAGYQPVGRRPGYYLPRNAEPVAALVLRKDL